MISERLDPTRGYGDEPAPLLGRAILTGTFFAALGTGVVTARRAGVRLPREVAVRDVVATGVATYKLARMISKDRVTTFARAPFTEFEQPTGHGEVEERPRGSGLRRAVGELVVCPYCVGLWVASGLTAGLVVWPRPTRALVAVFDVLALADGLQAADRALQKRV
jgi:hypothetical protein